MLMLYQRLPQGDHVALGPPEEIVEKIRDRRAVIVQLNPEEAGYVPRLSLDTLLAWARKQAKSARARLVTSY